MSEHAKQINYLTKSLVDFLPLNFILLGAPKFKPSYSADLVNCTNAEELVNECGFLESL